MRIKRRMVLLSPSVIRHHPERRAQPQHSLGCDDISSVVRQGYSSSPFFLAQHVLHGRPYNIHRRRRRRHVSNIDDI